MVNSKLPDDWKTKSLSEVVGDGLFVDGDWVESKDQDPNGDVRLIQLADIGDGHFRNRSDRFLTNKKAMELGCTFLENGDLLVARMPDPLGRACVFPGDKKKSVTVVDVCVIRTTDVNHRWLMHAINSPQFRADVESLQSGSTRKRISRKNLEKIELPVPSLPEQERIVAKIEELFTQLEAGTSALAKVQAGLRRYKASVLKAAVSGDLTPHPPFPAGKGGAGGIGQLPDGWRWVALEELIQHLTSGSRGWAKYYSDSGSLFVRVGNFHRLSTTIDLAKIIFVNEPRGAESNRTRLQLKDLLITMTADVGMVGIVDEKTLRWGNAYINQHVGLVRLKEPDFVEYIAYALASEIGQKQFREKQYGATKTGLNFEDIKSLQIPLPPLDEQRRIVAEVERRLSVAREVESAVEGALVRASRLRQAVLKSAFEGRLG
jgi:type I restriction enzyme, S subunit